MTEFERQVLADLASLKAEMKVLLGNGQPGRLRLLEERVERHEVLAQRAAGVGALAGGLLTIFHLAIDYWKVRH